MKFCRAQYLLCWMIAVLGVGSVLSGCGQKGGLVRPVVSADPTDSVEHKKEQ